MAGIQKPYENIYWRCAIALLAAHYILSHTSNYGFFQVIAVPGYWPSLLASFIIAFLLTQIVYLTTIFLDKHFPYAINWRKRLGMQCLMGIVAVSALAVSLAYIYFYLNSVVERLPDYMRLDFPIILAFIIGLNAYYFIRYLISINRTLIKQLYNVLRRNRKMQVLQEISAQQHEKQIAFIVRYGKNYTITYDDGTSFVWFEPLRVTIEKLKTQDFFLINPTCIVSRRAIQKIKRASSKRLKIYINPKIIAHSNYDNFYVSQSNCKQFMKWYSDHKIW